MEGRRVWEPEAVAKVAQASPGRKAQGPPWVRLSPQFLAARRAGSLVGPCRAFFSTRSAAIPHRFPCSFSLLFGEKGQGNALRAVGASAG